MSCIQTQLKQLFEEAGLTPAEIAEELGMSEAAVCVGLTQCSTVYRKTAKAIEAAEVQDETEQVIEQIMKLNVGDNPSIALRAAMYLRDERKGRLDAKARVRQRQGGINIVVFNESIEAAKRRVLEMKRQAGLTVEAPMIELAQ